MKVQLSEFLQKYWQETVAGGKRRMPLRGRWRGNAFRGLGFRIYGCGNISFLGAFGRREFVGCQSFGRGGKQVEFYFFWDSELRVQKNVNSWFLYVLKIYSTYPYVLKIYSTYPYVLKIYSTYPYDI